MDNGISIILKKIRDFKRKVYKLNFSFVEKLKL